MNQMTVEELKKMKIWLLWRKQKNCGRVAKVPFSAIGGICGTNEVYRGTWVTYEKAVAAAKPRDADGIGFKIPNGMFFWILIIGT